MRVLKLLLLGAVMIVMNVTPGKAQKIKVGEPAPDFTVPSLDGKTTYRLSDFRGHRVLVFNWASWWVCREELPVWQKFYEKHHQENFEILSVSMDTQGAEVARRFTEAAGVTYPSAVDRAQGLWDLYGFPVVPNGFFVDEQGILRYAKIGDFDARNPVDVAAIERLLAAPSIPPATQPGFEYTRSIEEALHRAEEALKRDPANLDLRLTLAERRVEAKQDAQGLREFQSVVEKNPESTRALVGLATAYLDLGQKEKALSALRQASALDPGNWIIHKQIWAIGHPEEFYPAINGKWQEEQLQQEKGKQ